MQLILNCAHLYRLQGNWDSCKTRVKSWRSTRRFVMYTCYHNMYAHYHTHTHTTHTHTHTHTHTEAHVYIHVTCVYAHVHSITALNSQIRVADRPVTQQGLAGMRTGSKGTSISFNFDSWMSLIIHHSCIMHFSNL